jgi:glutamate formiminotransferase
MRLLCVANWSEGRNKDRLDEIRGRLSGGEAEVHYDGSDPDHNRIVTAFSGSGSEIRNTLLSIAKFAFKEIDMREHQGVHPRVGALDVCPFIVLGGAELDAIEFTKNIGDELSQEFDLPVFLYEKSESGRHSADLPSLRKGQFEGLSIRHLEPDFGPRRSNPKLGVTILGVRDWLIAMNINVERQCLKIAKSIAREIRLLRDAGDNRFAGVRALGLDLESQDRAQISLNLTMPDNTEPDEIIRWVVDQVPICETQLIGVIRERDLPRSTLLPVSGRQILRSV